MPDMPGQQVSHDGRSRLLLFATSGGVSETPMGYVWRTGPPPSAVHLRVAKGAAENRSPVHGPHRMSPSLLASDPSNWIDSTPPTQLLPCRPAGVFWCAADYPNDQCGGRVVGRMQVTKPQWRRGDSSNPVLRGVQDLAQDPAQDQTDAVGAIP